MEKSQIKYPLNHYEFHFFHGFLGRPQDWDVVIQSLGNVKTICHDLFYDINHLAESPDLFQGWAQSKIENWSEDIPRVLIGYSLGGRLAQYIPPQYYHALILVGAHPGLAQDHEARLESDGVWADLLREGEQELWLERWNQQEVFRYDKMRPQRQILNSELSVYRRQLMEWSLGKQWARDHWLYENREKIFWVLGEKDKKFQLLKERMIQNLGSDHIYELEQSGHGVIFDQPEALAQCVRKILHND